MEYKSAVLSYKASRQEQPPYLSLSLQPYRPSRSLRSLSTELLHISKRKKTVGYVATVVSPSPPLVFGTICLYLLEHCQQLRQF